MDLETPFNSIKQIFFFSSKKAVGLYTPVRSLPVEPLWCDLGFFLNSRGNKAVTNLRPTWSIKANS